MNELLQLFLIALVISIPPLIGAIFNYMLKKNKVKAETEEINLKNKITKDITYDQLKARSKHENVKNKIQIFQELTDLEEKLKVGGKLTADKQKKLEALEMLKEEFKTSFAEPEKKSLTEPIEKLLVDKKGSKLPRKKKISRKKS